MIKDGPEIRADTIYEIMSAIRGPDRMCMAEEASVLKTIVTSRIRSIVLHEDQCGGAEYCSTPLTLPEVQRVCCTVITVGPYAAHYIAHLYHAVEVTQRHPVWGRYGDVLCMVLKHNYSGSWRANEMRRMLGVHPVVSAVENGNMSEIEQRIHDERERGILHGD